MTFNLRDIPGLLVRVSGCRGDHPDACTAYLVDADGRPVIADARPYAWTLRMEPGSGPGYFDLSKAEQTLIGDFLELHGITPTTRFINGNTLEVRVRCDGTLMLHTWRAVVDTGDLVMCESCPGCVKQERVIVPLAAPVPDVPGAYIDPGSPWLPKRRATDRRHALNALFIQPAVYDAGGLAAVNLRLSALTSAARERIVRAH
ncbi:hypothetical protein [Actinoplanes sp. URMC 104]|uniref:hypothetical protein n=1 Tax=Actinoplanes sp. URMC 104 TaxID=3423409 RepID=UPI003F19E60A